jgi:Ca2+-binding RTX toxin-like protein
MRKRTTLVAACAAVAATALSAQSAFAGDVRVIDQSTGQPRLLFTEARTAPDPTGATSNVPEQNNVTISLSGTAITVQDTIPLNQVPGRNYPGCASVDPNTVSCDATGMSQLSFNLGDLEDRFNNTTAIPAGVVGGSGTDTIVSAGAGDDLISVNGGSKPETDIVGDCGAGNDTVDADRKDDLTAAANCETIKVGGVVLNPGTPPPPPGGVNTPTPPAGKPVVSASPAGTPAPLSVAQLGIAPTRKAGACAVRFIGTATADRIEGTPGGDIEYGMAGDDYMRGQAGDDCLYGLNGNDTLIAEEGGDLLVGGDGRDRLYAGPGTDRLFGNAGNDRLNGDAGVDRLSGGDGADLLRGGANSDQIFGGLGNDLADAGPGNDVISAGPGADHVIAGAGNDRINVRDHRRDVVNCGAGRDSVTADRVDKLLNCERATRR